MMDGTGSLGLPLDQHKGVVYSIPRNGYPKVYIHRTDQPTPKKMNFKHSVMFILVKIS